jgi:hypothetical protein
MTNFSTQDATIKILHITGANPKLNLTSTLERLYEESRSNNNPKEA